MDSVINKTFLGKIDEDDRKYFLRYGKGSYPRRFLISFNRGKTKVKIYGSFEWCDDFVKFIKELKDVKFSGQVFMKEKIPGLEGKKKAGSFIYEVSESDLSEFENVFHYLVACKDSEIVLKVKKSFPKPGKNAAKIDDKFCMLELDLKFWEKVKEVFFSDIEDCKKCLIEHELIFEEIVLPEGEKDSAKVRELAKRKGKIIRKINCDEKETSKEFEVEI